MTDVYAVLESADDLLRRLSQWDVLNLPAGSGDDGPYWQAAIRHVRNQISQARVEKANPHGNWERT